MVIDAATQRQIGGLFECRDLGTVELKGLSAVGAGMARAGRGDRSMSQFPRHCGPAPRRWWGARKRWRSSSADGTKRKGGKERVVLISGEPGIGKSRMIAALTQRIEGEPCARAALFFLPAASIRTALFHPIIAQLDGAAGATAFRTRPRKNSPGSRSDLLAADYGRPSEDVVLLAVFVGAAGLPNCNPFPFNPRPRNAKSKGRSRRWSARSPSQLRAEARWSSCSRTCTGSIPPRSYVLSLADPAPGGPFPGVAAGDVPRRFRGALAWPARRDAAVAQPP